MKYRYHKDMDPPQPGQIFVFGSNLAGRHGAGAALYARDNCGAVLGVGSGPTGKAYAIATKDERIQTRPLFDVKEDIEAFVHYTRNHPEIDFFVTRVGCGLAGYKDSDIAHEFKGAPSNCDFPEEWKPYLEE